MNGENWAISFLLPKTVGCWQLTAFGMEGRLAWSRGWIVRVANKSGIDEKKYPKSLVLSVSSSSSVKDVRIASHLALVASSFMTRVSLSSRDSFCSMFIFWKFRQSDLSWMRDGFGFTRAFVISMGVGRRGSRCRLGSLGW